MSPMFAMGAVVRTEFLLRYLSDLDLRRIIQVAMNKSERFNQFTQWVGFGGEVVITENDRAEHLSPYLTEHINRFGVYEWSPHRIASPINYDLEILPALFQ